VSFVYVLPTESVIEVMPNVDALSAIETHKTRLGGLAPEPVNPAAVVVGDPDAGFAETCPRLVTVGAAIYLSGLRARAGRYGRTTAEPNAR
jgi:hypothetical protein